MNCIIDSTGTIISLQQNIAQLCPFDISSKGKINLFDIITGLPNIFPLTGSEKELEFKNLQLVKNIGLFSTHQNEDYVNLKIQQFSIVENESNYLCNFEFHPNSLENTRASELKAKEISNKVSNNLFIKLIEGSVFTVNKKGVVSSIIQDGDAAILSKYNIHIGINLIDAVDKANADLIRADLENLNSENSSKNIIYKFRDRYRELIVEGKLYYIDSDEFLYYVKDVTALKKLEREKEEFAKFPIDNPNPVLRLSISGKILFANAPAIDFTRKIGKANNIVTNKDLKAVIKAGVYDGVTRSLKIKINKEFYFLTVSPNKEYKYVNIYALNITQQETFHEKLKQKTVDLNSILNSSDDSILLTNKNFDLVYFNSKASELFGTFGVKQLNTWTQVFNYIPKIYQNKFIFNATKCLTSSSIINSEIQVEGGDNNGRIFSIIYYPAVDKVQNKIIGICIQIREITEAERNKEEILRQKIFYESILNNLPTDIAVLDSNMNYLFINPTAISNPEVRNFMIGKNDFDYAKFKNLDTGFAERRKRLFEEVKNTGIPITFEDIHQKNGKNVVILRKYFPVYKNGQMEMMLGYGLDITSIRESEQLTKKSEEEVRIANNKLQRNYTQLMQYSYIVSHNLRAPIANLIGLSKCFKETDEGYNQTIINHIKESSQRIDEILKDLNTILAIREEVNGSLENIDLEETFSETTKDLKDEISNAKPIIITDFSESRTIKSVHSFIHSIFYNLISNSIKYRNPSRTCKIYITSHKRDKQCIIKFMDNGIGIDLEKHGNKIFGLYKRFHKDIATGSGIGLHLIKEQIETLGGTITVESAPEKGTEFIITLNHNLDE